MAISRAQRNAINKENSKDATGNVWYRFNMYCMSLLVNARTLDEIDSILEDVTICLLSENQNEMLRLSYERVWTKIHSMENKDGPNSN